MERISLSETGEQTNDHSYNLSISSDGKYITFSSPATNLVPDDTNFRNDVFVVENPLANVINLVGKPEIDQSTESGVYVWKNNAGRTFVKVVAGDPGQNGQVANFNGSMLSEDVISSLNPISIESAAPNNTDTLTQVNSSRVDFDLNVVSPYKDVFSFVADPQFGLCVLLNDYAGGLFLGPDKVEVNPPYDIHSQSACDVRTLPFSGAPQVDKNTDHGIFIWKIAGNRYKSSVVAADGFSVVDINIDSQQPLSDFVAIGLEANDVVDVTSDEINLDLCVAAGSKDAFKFKALNGSNTCFSTTGAMPIYLGPLRAKLSSSVNLDTLKVCQ